jgi:formylglycine-generating enzyme required for sulfatase activity
MGSPFSEADRTFSEGPQIQVTISRGFLIGLHEVTQSEYVAVMTNNPSMYPSDAGPVDSVSWQDATNYCALLTQREQAAGLIAANYAYRLPTEAEWEYACRAGTTTRFSYGDDPGYSQLSAYAWSWIDSGQTSHPVGTKAANPWGLYDMHGNVAEWCQDFWYVDLNHLIGNAIDPVGVSPNGVDMGNRVVRGGSWQDVVGGPYRSASRNFAFQANGYKNIGFRVVLAPR